MEEETRDGRLGGERPRDSFLPRQVSAATLSVFADCFLPFCLTLRKKYCTVLCRYNLALSWCPARSLIEDSSRSHGGKRLKARFQLASPLTSGFLWIIFTLLRFFPPYLVWRRTGTFLNRLLWEEGIAIVQCICSSLEDRRHKTRCPSLSCYCNFSGFCP